MGVMIGLGFGAFYLIRIVIAAAKHQDKAPFIKGLGMSAIAVVVCFVLFSMTQSPEQKAQSEAIIAARKQAEEAQRIADEKAAAEKAEAERKAAEAKKIADEKSAAEVAERKAREDAQRQYNAMIRDITTGWNTETTNMEINDHNWQKAAELVLKYPDYIHSAAPNWINVFDAMKKPWEYYGQVVNLSGRIYAIEQLPPGNSVAKFFNGSCYSAMLSVDDGYDHVAVAMHIVGSADDIYEDATVSLKGYIYGHSNLVNNMGGSSKGLSFIGFRES